ncbi:MAG: hydrogenase expression protein [Candidatus Tectomicrobia bacterium]|uniref:Hydrogenase expression protein n=1 Tax=Tectimicrobiota bacterium TaxID=2528274 RepID=A0A937VYU7_UNCTE|nr:hydrogenase expression protein [Candidatus Tectomicrobia bacterium]
MTPAHLPPGKLPPALLAHLLAQEGSTDPRVLIGPRVGVDAAVIDMGDRLLIAKSDPITFATDAIGYYAVTVNANDIAAMGGTPRWFLATVLLPEHSTTEELVQTIFAQIRRACSELGIALVGGHTEITVGLDRPILSGHMLGETTHSRLVTSAGVQPGDAILLTKGFPVEGIAIMARERAAQLTAHGHTAEEIARWQQFLFTPGISVVREAQVLQQAVTVHAMHDPTEGGLATGLREMAQASGVGLCLDAERLPLLPEGALLCQAFGLDPLGTIASGALLAAVPAAQAASAIRACTEAGIACYGIGTATADPTALGLQMGAVTRPLPLFRRDEILTLFA